MRLGRTLPRRQFPATSVGCPSMKGPRHGGGRHDGRTCGSGEDVVPACDDGAMGEQVFDQGLGPGGPGQDRCDYSGLVDELRCHTTEWVAAARDEAVREQRRWRLRELAVDPGARRTRCGRRLARRGRRRLGARRASDGRDRAGVGRPPHHRLGRRRGAALRRAAHPGREGRRPLRRARLGRDRTRLVAEGPGPEGPGAADADGGGRRGAAGGAGAALLVEPRLRDARRPVLPPRHRRRDRSSRCSTR